MVQMSGLAIGNDMKNILVLSVIGADRAGIVDELSSAIIKNGGNWLESRMCNLAGQFAGVLMVECSSQKQPGLHEALKKLENNGLMIQFAPAKASQHDQGADIDLDQCGRTNIELELTGPDHPGIIHDIAHFLASRNINIAEMDSHCQEGAMSGGYVFHSKIVASIPKSQEIDEVENALGDLADKLNVDITLDDLKGKRTRI